LFLAVAIDVSRSVTGDEALRPFHTGSPTAKRQVDCDGVVISASFNPDERTPLQSVVNVEAQSVKFGAVSPSSSA
jgi:hypothetical protein